MLARERARVANTEARLARTKEPLYLANVKTKATEDRAIFAKERAASTIVQAVEEYKDFDDFENDAIEAREIHTLLGLLIARKRWPSLLGTRFECHLVVGEVEGETKGEEKLTTRLSGPMK